MRFIFNQYNIDFNTNLKLLRAYHGLLPIKHERLLNLKGVEKQKKRKEEFNLQPTPTNYSMTNFHGF